MTRQYSKAWRQRNTCYIPHIYRKLRMLQLMARSPGKIIMSLEPEIRLCFPSNYQIWHKNLIAIWFLNSHLFFISNRSNFKQIGGNICIVQDTSLRIVKMPNLVMNMGTNLKWSVWYAIRQTESHLNFISIYQNLCRPNKKRLLIREEYPDENYSFKWQSKG